MKDARRGSNRPATNIDPMGIMD